MNSVGSIAGRLAIRLPIRTDMFSKQSLCRFLKNKKEVERSVSFLKRNGFIPHPCEPKNWDLSYILPQICDGNFLDLGSWESYILENVIRKGVQGMKFGIDLQRPVRLIEGVNYLVGDMVATGLPSGFFRNISCVSVLEHGVDIGRFVSEAARLLQDRGRLFVTFDYWDPKVTPANGLYGLDWQPLDKQSVNMLIQACRRNDLFRVSQMDWRIEEAVIREGYCSPDPSVSYTFGLLVFEKRSKWVGCHLP